MSCINVLHSSDSMLFWTSRLQSRNGEIIFLSKCQEHSNWFSSETWVELKIMKFDICNEEIMDQTFKSVLILMNFWWFLWKNIGNKSVMYTLTFQPFLRGKQATTYIKALSSHHGSHSLHISPSPFYLFLSLDSQNVNTLVELKTPEA